MNIKTALNSNNNGGARRAKKGTCIEQYVVDMVKHTLNGLNLNYSIQHQYKVFCGKYSFKVDVVVLDEDGVPLKFIEIGDYKDSNMIHGILHKFGTIVRIFPSATCLIIPMQQACTNDLVDDLINNSPCNFQPGKIFYYPIIDNKRKSTNTVDYILNLEKDQLQLYTDRLYEFLRKYLG